MRNRMIWLKKLVDCNYWISDSGKVSDVEVSGWLRCTDRLAKAIKKDPAAKREKVMLVDQTVVWDVESEFPVKQHGDV